MMSIVHIRRNGSTGRFAVHYDLRVTHDPEPQDVYITDIFDSGDCEVQGLLSSDAVDDIKIEICREVDGG